MPSLLSKFTKNGTSNTAQPELDRNPAHRRTRVSSEHASSPRLNGSQPLPPFNASAADTQGSLPLPTNLTERRASSPQPQNQNSNNQNTSPAHIRHQTELNHPDDDARAAGSTSTTNPSMLVSTQPQLSSSGSAVESTTAVPESATTSGKRRQSASESSYILQKPFVGSPPQFDNILAAAQSTNLASATAMGADADLGIGMGMPSSSPPTTPPSQKKSSWRRRSSASSRGKQGPQRRIHPSGGLASAIANTGLSLANTAIQRRIDMPTNNNSNIYRTVSTTSDGRDRHTQSRRSSASTSPNGFQDSSPSYRSMTLDTVSTSKDDDSSLGNEDEEEDEDDEEDEEEETSQDEFDPLSSVVAPITGFAVASNKRTADFHALFPTVPEGDYLIDDYGCALQREILIQGRLYISENHLCFHANIFGWTTDLVIPIEDITHVEKKMTAYVIPNAIQVTTYTSKHTFASLLNRESTYDVLYNIWRSVRPEDIGVNSSPRGSLDMNRTGTNSMGSVLEGMASASGTNSVISPVGARPPTKAPAANKTSFCACGRAGEHYPETAMDIIVPGEPEKIYNLMFASGFVKDFMREEKLMDIQISDWTPKTSGSHLLQRNMSYIKPLNGSIGPKQTKCELSDEMIHLDYDDYISMLTTTRTPDVPSGGVFSVKTRTCLMWASRASTRIIVTTTVVWTGRSFVKGIIERSCIDGQKTYHTSLERSMRRYIAENKAEFLPGGADAEVDLQDALVSGDSASPPPALPTPELSSEDIRKAKEKERSQRGLQWALDTVEGTAKVARQSFWGAIELIKDTWESSSTTAVLWFVVVGLLLSNIWTYFRAGRQAAKHARRYKDASFPYPYPPYTPLREDEVQRVVGESVRDAFRMIEDVVRSGGSSDSKTSNPGAEVGVGKELAEMKKKVESLEEKIIRLELELLNSPAQAPSSLNALD